MYVHVDSCRLDRVLCPPAVSPPTKMRSRLAVTEKKMLAGHTIHYRITSVFSSSGASSSSLQSSSPSLDLSSIPSPNASVLSSPCSPGSSSAQLVPGAPGGKGAVLGNDCIQRGAMARCRREPVHPNGHEQARYGVGPGKVGWIVVSSWITSFGSDRTKTNMPWWRETRG